MIDRSRSAGWLGCALLSFAAGNALAADAASDYPSRPIRAVVPSPAGGPPDLILRMLAPKLVASLGQQIVIDNRAGSTRRLHLAFHHRLAHEHAAFQQERAVRSGPRFHARLAGGAEFRPGAGGSADFGREDRAGAAYDRPPQPGKAQLRFRRP